MASALACVAVVVACGSITEPTPPSTRNPAKLQVVTTVAPITSIVAQVAGPDAEVAGLVP